MARSVTAHLVLLLLSWACAELADAQRFEIVHGYQGSFGSAFSSDRDYDYPNSNADYDHPEHELATRLRDAPAAASALEYQSDGETAFEDVAGTAVIEEIAEVPLPTRLSEGFSVFCSDGKMTVRLPPGPTEKIEVWGSKGFIPVVVLPKSCGYSLSEGLEHNSLTISFMGCHIICKNGLYAVKLVYLTYDGQAGAADPSCAAGPPSSIPSMALLKGPLSDEPLLAGTVKRKTLTSKCPGSPHGQTESATLTTPPPCSPSDGKPCFLKVTGPSVSGHGDPKANCKVPQRLQIPCGPSGITASHCLTKGCCVDPHTSSCFQPLPGSPHGQTESATLTTTPPCSPSDGKLCLRKVTGPSVSGHGEPKENCKVPQRLQIPCGPSGITAALCLAKGCCVDPHTASCFYPLDECTADRNFVVAVYRTDGPYPVDPSSLVVAGKDRCPPVLHTSDAAVFKFSVTECGTRSHVLENTEVFTAEIQSNLKVYNLKYGAITRDGYFRLSVECRYPKSSALGAPFLVTSGYVVKRPSWPLSVASGALYDVQLKIATDSTYTEFYPQDNQPLKTLLGKPVFLELELITSDTTAVLLVNYCIAYPRSATNALVLIYEGCPNKLDGLAAVLYTKGLPQSKQWRRFKIETFQFIDLKSKKFLDEPIHFMCYTEVCLPSEKPCNEGCFGRA